MAGQYQEFYSYIKKYGVSKTSHFGLSIPVTLVNTSGEKFSDINKLLGLRCETTELPGRQLVSNDSRTYGPTYKTPYQSLYQEIIVNFLETGNLIIRDFFETWMNSIFNSKNNQLAYPDSYRFDTTLTQYDVSDGSRPNSIKEPETPQASLRTVAVWTLYKTFPTAVNQMPVSWSEDGLHRVTVTLAFEWYALKIGSGIVNGKSELKSPQVPAGGSART